MERVISQRMTRLASALIAAAMLFAACGSGTGSREQATRSAAPSGAIKGDASELRSFTRISDWKTGGLGSWCDQTCKRSVGTSALVVVVNVVDEKGTAADNDSRLPEEGQEVLRDVVAEVEEPIRGTAPEDGRLVIRNGYWIERNGARQPGIDGSDSLWLQVGDRALVAVMRGRQDPSRYYFFTGSSAFLLRNGEVVDTDRRAPIVRQLEKLTEGELKARAKEESA